MIYTIWTTAACNLKCKYCYEGTNKPNHSMTIDTAKKVISFIEKDNKENEELLVNFHGGEPFLNFQIIKYIVKELSYLFQKKKNIAFTATTNATVLNEEILDFIKKYKMELTISLDGKKDTHDKFRKFADGKGSFDLAMEKAKKIKAFNPNIRIRMTIVPDTVEKLSENVEFLLQEGFTCVVPGIDSFTDEWNEESFSRFKEEILKLKEISKQYPTCGIGILEPLFRCGKYCNGGRSSKHIYYNGEIYPCLISCGNREFNIGNVNDGINIRKRDQLLSYSNMENKVCQGCDIQEFCLATRCKIVNKIKTSDYFTPSLVDCYYTNLMYETNGVRIES